LNNSQFSLEFAVLSIVMNMETSHILRPTPQNFRLWRKHKEFSLYNKNVFFGLTVGIYSFRRSSMILHK
jgi:hypothetical protein